MFIISWFLYKSDMRNTTTGKLTEMFMINYLEHLEKQQYLPRYWSDKGFKGAAVNRASQSLNEVSLEITLTYSTFNII